MPGKHWTEEEIEELHRLVEIGLSYKQIAECLNRSYRSLRAHCSRLGISNSKESRIRSFFDSAPDECLTLDDVKVKTFSSTWNSSKPDSRHRTRTSPVSTSPPKARPHSKRHSA